MHVPVAASWVQTQRCCNYERCSPSFRIFTAVANSRKGFSTTPSDRHSRMAKQRCILWVALETVPGEFRIWYQLTLRVHG